MGVGKYKIMGYGIVIGFLLSLTYSVFIYYTNTEWGDLASIASFIVIFPATILVTIIIQIFYIFFINSKK